VPRPAFFRDNLADGLKQGVIAPVMLLEVLRDAPVRPRGG
jgi:hypothetical protein